MKTNALHIRRKANGESPAGDKMFYPFYRCEAATLSFLSAAQQPFPINNYSFLIINYSLFTPPPTS
jgi:hypothetical protein